MKKDGTLAGRVALAQARKSLAAGMGYAVALTFVTSLLSLTLPFYSMQVYDRVMSSQSTDTLLMLSVLAALALVISGALDFVRAATFQAVARMVLGAVSGPALEAAVTAASQRGANMAAQALSSLHELRSFIVGGAIAVPLEAIWTPLLFLALFAIHPIYGFVACVSAGLLVVVGLLSDAMTRRAVQQANAANVQNLAEIGATLRHAEVIEAMGMLPALGRRWHRSQELAMDRFDTANRRSRALTAATRVLRQGMQMAALCAGVILVIRQDVSPGSMMACSIIMGRLLLPFEQMVDGWRQWVVAATAWKKLQSLLVEEVPPRDRTPTPLPHGPLIVEGLVYAPPGADMPIIKGVSFTLEPGEVLGIAGASAAGKSTLARLITGVLKPTAGGVYLDGHSTYVWERGSFGRAVGYLPQSVSLIEGTIRENIARMEACDPKAVIAAARLAGVHDMIGRLPFGYDTDVAENGHMLSGGQRQRIGLARALYGNPRLLVLDEPNANLDAEGEAALLRAIAHAKSEGAIVVIIAHRASVMQAADRLIVIENGRIAQDGARGEQPASLVSSRPRLTTVPA